MIEPVLKKSIHILSAIILHSFSLPFLCLPAESNTETSDTNNSASTDIVLQSQTASFSPEKIENKLPVVNQTHESNFLNNGFDQRSDLKVFKQPNAFNQPIYMRRVVPIILDSIINTKSVKIGDNVEARLKENLYYGMQLIAPANAILKGRVVSIRDHRTLCQSTIHTEDRFKSGAALEILFDNICPSEHYFIPITGKLVHQEITRIGDDGLLYGIKVDYQGRVIQGGRTLSSNQKHIYTAIRLSTGIPIPAGMFANMAAGPFLMGTLGAICPDIAFNKAVDPAMTHKRLKGATYGFVTSLPGAFFVQAVVEKGDEVLLYKGDEMMIDLSINNHLICPQQLVHKDPRALIVEAKLIDKQDIKKTSALPLKTSLDEHAADKNELAKDSISSLATQQPN